jgi:hypothetical protein
MVFGYNARPIFASSTAGIVEHARDLLRCLVERREGRDVSCFVFGDELIFGEEGSDRDTG